MSVAVKDTSMTAGLCSRPSSMKIQRTSKLQVFCSPQCLQSQRHSCLCVAGGNELTIADNVPAFPVFGPEPVHPLYGYDYMRDEGDKLVQLLHPDMRKQSRSATHECTSFQDNDSNVARLLKVCQSPNPLPYVTGSAPPQFSALQAANIDLFHISH